jgi:hypothetical protein
MVTMPFSRHSYRAEALPHEGSYLVEQDRAEAPEHCREFQRFLHIPAYSYPSRVVVPRIGDSLWQNDHLCWKLLWDSSEYMSKQQKWASLKYLSSALGRNDLW